MMPDIVSDSTITRKTTGGFSLPHGETTNLSINLVNHLMVHPNSTFAIRVGSMAMKNIGIYKGDTLLVDRSLEPRHNQVILAVVNGEFVVRRIYFKQNQIELRPENPRFPTIIQQEGTEIIIWGVVVSAIKQVFKDIDSDE